MWMIFALYVIAAQVANTTNNDRQCDYSTRVVPWYYSTTVLPWYYLGKVYGDGWRIYPGWRCWRRKLCIDAEGLCNGSADCGDGEDESVGVCGGFGKHDRTCTNPVTGIATGWRCKTGSKACIKTIKICDGQYNCDDGEDESATTCGGFGKHDRTCTNPVTGKASGWRCKTGRKTCIANSKICDGQYDCDYGEDENFCSSSVMQPGCHGFGCHTCAADARILTSSKYWNGTNSVENCRSCDPRTVSDSHITWRRCNDGSCYNTIVGCDGKTDCLDGSDELNCPWYSSVSATNTMTVCFVVVLLCLMICMLMKKLKLIDTRVEYKEGPVEMDVVNVDKFIAKMKTSTEMDEDIKQIYDDIHQRNQLSQLVSVVNIYFTGLNIAHEITTLIIELEKGIHCGRRQALLCLRVNAGSNADIERLLSFEGDPGFLKKTKKKATQAMDAFLGQFYIQHLVNCFPYIKIWSYKISKILIASFKVTLFLWDFVKDMVLWILLYGKTDELESSENFLLWIFLSLIFCAQSIVGFYITSQYKTILSLPENMKTFKKVFVLILMFFLTPCLPSLVIFKSTVYSMDIAAIVANARSNNYSQPSTVLKQINGIKEKHRIHTQIYAYARVIEATLETFPQVVLLTSYLSKEGGLRSILLNEDNLNSSTSIFFIISLPYSIVMIVTAIISFINTQKRGSLGLLTSSILGMSYLFQITSSMVCWVFIFGRILIDNLHSNMIMLIPLISLFLITTWLFTFFWTIKMVQPFKEAPILEQMLHILVNTYVTIPYRDSKDQGQRRKSTEIFWHFLVRTCINLIMVSIFTLITNDDVNFYGISLTFLGICFILPISLFFQLLGGLLMWIFYKNHPWEEINHSSCHFCCFPSTPCVCSPVTLWKILKCFFIGLIQVIFGLFCCFCCDFWIIWCRCFELDKFEWVGWRKQKFEIQDRERLAVDELVKVTFNSQSQNLPKEERPMTSIGSLSRAPAIRSMSWYWEDTRPSKTTRWLAAKLYRNAPVIPGRPH